MDTIKRNIKLKKKKILLKKVYNPISSGEFAVVRFLAVAGAASAEITTAGTTLLISNVAGLVTKENRSKLKTKGYRFISNWRFNSKLNQIIRLDKK